MKEKSSSLLTSKRNEISSKGKVLDFHLSSSSTKVTEEGKGKEPPYILQNARKLRQSALCIVYERPLPFFPTVMGKARGTLAHREGGKKSRRGEKGEERGDR